MAIVAYFLYIQIGWPSFVGIGLLLLLAPAQMFMGRLLMRFRYVHNVPTLENINLHSHLHLILCQSTVWNVTEGNIREFNYLYLLTNLIFLNKFITM